MTDWPGFDLPWFDRFEAAAGRLGLDALDILLQRARIERRVHSGPISTGGACRILPAADGWVAVNLPRRSDLELVPAWLGTPAEDWQAIAAAVRSAVVAGLVDRAALLGLAVAAPPGLPDEQLLHRSQTPTPAPYLSSPGGASGRAGSPRVVDLSAMWAGPLCGALLVASGAKVAKVESPARPDPPSELNRRLNAGKELLSVPLGIAEGTAVLRELLANADVVIESSRPRVMQQWEISPDEFVAAGGVWVSITAYGRTGPWSNRPGFGDDAAVAGGLWYRREFVGDAIADPITGVFAALGALEALDSGRGALVDVAMREAVAHVVGSDQ